MLDEQLPRQLAPLLAGHEVSTVQQKGWAGCRNGELLRSAESAGFELFLTADRGLEFQTNLRSRILRILVVVTPTNRLSDLAPLAPKILAAIPGAMPGRVVRVGR
ncbi:MAG TPA: hypothetical protein VMV17_05180 [Streptosporangiaceae bacterium]|nr:hypothetical protein [Streptosporangiaceae bacterium]